MTLIQYLCQLLSEECGEIIQRASKLSRFGADEVQSNQELDNFERLRAEKVDLMVVYNLLLQATGRQDECVSFSHDERIKKEQKLLTFTRYSVKCGAISEGVYRELKDIMLLD